MDHDVGRSTHCTCNDRLALAHRFDDDIAKCFGSDRWCYTEQTPLPGGHHDGMGRITYNCHAARKVSGCVRPGCTNQHQRWWCDKLTVGVQQDADTFVRQERTYEQNVWLSWQSAQPPVCVRRFIGRTRAQEVWYEGLCHSRYIWSITQQVTSDRLLHVAAD